MRKSSLGAFGSALAFALTWFCCLPLGVGALGATMAAVGNFAGPFQPLFVLLSLGFLSVATVQTVREIKCRDADNCERSSVMNRVMFLTLLSLVILVFLILPYWSSYVIYWFL